MNAVRSPYTRSVWFNAATRVEPGKDHIFSELDEEKHTKRRQQMAAGVSSQSFSRNESATLIPSAVLRQRESCSRIIN
jgi:hypothetical protein